MSDPGSATPPSFSDSTVPNSTDARESIPASASGVFASHAEPVIDSTACITIVSSCAAEGGAAGVAATGAGVAVASAAPQASRTTCRTSAVLGASGDVSKLCQLATGNAPTTASLCFETLRVMIRSRHAIPSFGSRVPTGWSWRGGPRYGGVAQARQVQRSPQHSA
eukprot:5869154-Prymnesium_polylepis.3